MEQFKLENLREFEIWSEGCLLKNVPVNAVHHGKATGNNFRNACQNFFENMEVDSHFFDIKYLTYQGRRLYQNENDARRV